MSILTECACWLCCFNNEMFYGINYFSLLARKGLGAVPLAFPWGTGSDL